MTHFLWIATFWLGLSPSPTPANAATFHEEVIVTATATERRPVDVPYTVESLQADDLRLRRLARTLPEALAEVPGIMVQKTAHGQGSPFIRGFTGFRNLFLIDGVRLNNSVFRDGPNQYWATVDPLGLERLEVVKGPVSALYGSDAIGGTVHAITRAPLRTSAERAAAGRLYHRYSSAEASHVTRLEVGGGVGSRFRYFAGGSFKAFGELKAGGGVGRQRKTDYDEWDVDFKGTYDLGAERELVVGFQRVALEDAWRTHRTIFGSSWRGTTVGNEKRRSLDQNRWLSYLKLRQTASTPLFDRLEATLSHHRQDEERLRIRSDERSDRQGFTVGSTGIRLQLEKTLGPGLFSYGLEHYRDEVDSFRDRFAADGSFQRSDVQGPVADDATYDLWGLYVQHDLEVNRHLSLLLGARYDRAEANARRVMDPMSGEVISITGAWDKVVANARLLHRLGTGGRHHLFAGASQGFRAPNLSDLTRLDSARSNEIETPSPDLEPETFLSYELGWKGRGSAWSAELTAFYTDIDELILRTPTGRVIDGEFEVTKRNSGEGSVHGFEGSARVRFGRGFHAFSAWTWMDGDVLTFPSADPIGVREPLDRLMPTTGHLGLRRDFASRDGWLELVWTAADRQDRLSTRDRADTQRIPPGGTPGYDVLTLRGGLAVRPGWQVHAAIENLADEEYRIHGSGLNQAGRNLVVALELDF